MVFLKLICISYVPPAILPSGVPLSAPAFAGQRSFQTGAHGCWSGQAATNGRGQMLSSLLTESTGRVVFCPVIPAITGIAVGIWCQLCTHSFRSRIDANVEDTSMNVEAAHTEILKYFQSVTNNRWLMIKVFGVLIFFFLIFVVFMS